MFCVQPTVQGNGSLKILRVRSWKGSAEDRRSKSEFHLSIAGYDSRERVRRQPSFKEPVARMDASHQFLSPFALRTHLATEFSSPPGSRHLLVHIVRSVFGLKM